MTERWQVPTNIRGNRARNAGMQDPSLIADSNNPVWQQLDFPMAVRAYNDRQSARAPANTIGQALVRSIETEKSFSKNVFDVISALKSSLGL